MQDGFALGKQRAEELRLQCEGFFLCIDPSEGALSRVREQLGKVLTPPEAWRLTRLVADSGEYWLSPVLGGTLGQGEAWNLARRLEQIPIVLSAEPAFEACEPVPAACTEPFGQPFCQKDAELSDWPLRAMRVPEAWALLKELRGSAGQLGAGIRIAQPDTGYTFHPEIWSSEPQGHRLLVEMGYDFVDNDFDPVDPLIGSRATLRFPSHGTATASVLISAPMGAHCPWVSGIAPGAKLIPLRVSTSVVHFSFSNLTRAIYWAVEKGADIISMSLGGPFASLSLERALDYACSQGVILVAAVGNYYPWVVWPAAYGQVIGVAASTADDRLWEHSAQGPGVDVAAPGENVFVASTDAQRPEPYFVQLASGTSFACAEVSGLAALWLAYHGKEALIGQLGKAHIGAAFRKALIGSVRRPPGWQESRWGRGIVDAKQLLLQPIGEMSAALPCAERLSPLEHLGRLVPETPLARLELRLGHLLGARCSDELQTLLTTLGTELAALIATRLAWRAHLESAEPPAALELSQLHQSLGSGEISQALRQRLWQDSAQSFR